MNFGESFGIPKDKTPHDEKTPAQRVGKGLDLSQEEATWMAGGRAPVVDKAIGLSAKEEQGWFDEGDQTTAKREAAVAEAHRKVAALHEQDLMNMPVGGRKGHKKAVEAPHEEQGPDRMAA